MLQNSDTAPRVDAIRPARGKEPGEDEIRDDEMDAVVGVVTDLAAGSVRRGQEHCRTELQFQQ
jgi:hypothetical protein